MKRIKKGLTLPARVQLNYGLKCILISNLISSIFQCFAGLGLINVEGRWRILVLNTFTISIFKICNMFSFIDNNEYVHFSINIISDVV